MKVITDLLGKLKGTPAWVTVAVLLIGAFTDNKVEVYGLHRDVGDIHWQQRSQDSLRIKMAQQIEKIEETALAIKDTLFANRYNIRDLSVQVEQARKSAEGARLLIQQHIKDEKQ